ncbi:PP2C family protein-serine/threonine phosphatase [Amycolatopsis albispora]|uniref:Serine/threonine protein phosphatase n=1 Tax=Amycolatopsis albispora TaxID=1804986 RepID=A0A344L7R2_9PSEU|nr:PP2C family protein-serine/threonine phosphatase [Amycolatopsis albispora]AXB44086.1 serine/threonine protein phosphatase [Amycolatopsis albispora]
MQPGTDAPAATGPWPGLAERVTSELAGSLNLHRTALRLLDLLCPAFADWAVLALPELRTGRLVLHGGAEPSATTPATSRVDRETGLGHVLTAGRTDVLHVGEAAETGLDTMIPHAGLRAEAAALRPADVAGVPLTARGTTIGVLILVRAASRGFPAEDVAVAEQLAARAALALDSAQLYEDRTHVASVLQAGLRPPALPELPGARIAARIRSAAEHLDLSGDFYDVLGSGDDWLVVLGDVCGKGAEAAVLTGRTRQSIRTAAYFDRRPARVLTALNTVLYEADASRFVAVVCVRLRPIGDGSSAVASVAVAGHPPPVIIRAGGSIEQIEATGTVAGVLPDLAYREVDVRLHVGDTMLLCTDGIYEARGAGDFYGMDRLAELLPAYAGAGPEPLCEAVEQDVREYLGGRPHDDMALFAVTWGR